MWLWLDQLGKKGPTEAIMPREKPNSKHEPTSNQEPRSHLEGTVVEGRPEETIQEDGTISLKFDSSEIAAKWLWQEDRRRKGLPIATTTEKPRTTTTAKPAFIRIQDKLLEASSTTTATTTTQEPTTSTTTTNMGWNPVEGSGSVVVNHWAW